jgi:hypothetical protein
MRWLRFREPNTVLETPAPERSRERRIASLPKTFQKIPRNGLKEMPE